MILAADLEALRPAVPGAFEASQRARLLGQVLEIPVAAGQAVPLSAVTG